jgi:hypothetical protein
MSSKYIFDTDGITEVSSDEIDSYTFTHVFCPHCEKIYKQNYIQKHYVTTMHRRNEKHANKQN